jgi:hypothetical protein
MKYLDYSSLLSGEPAYLALFSTFQFDPNFFERRLLKCGVLQKARRIAIFMDAVQWHRMIQRDAPARRMNRRYLIVPVRRNEGVFHPKLNLLLTESGGQIQCGSNNLTRSGCASNLELLNSLPFEFEVEKDSARVGLAREVLTFFRQASQHTDEEVSRIAQEWIQEAEKVYPWPKEAEKDNGIELLHSFDGPFWDRIVEVLGGEEPQHVLVVSPFHDGDGALCRKLANQWPKAKVEIVVQQGYTTLPVAPLRNLKGFTLSEILESSRRVHAKLFAWKGKSTSGCVVGSANFTSAAMNGRNVEAVLLIRESWPMVEKLFDTQLKKRSIALEDFKPGEETPPEKDEWSPAEINISSAVLNAQGRIQIAFRHRFDQPPDSLRLTLRTPGETNPRFSMPMPRGSQGKAVLALPDAAIADAHGILLVAVTAIIDGKTFESEPVWVIQESRLTYEGGGGSSSSRSRIEETGEGLPEYLDEIGNRDGVAAMIDLLRRINIRFFDGGGGIGGSKKFRVRITDPFESDKIPEWLIQVKAEAEEVGEAILDFVDRHDKYKLRKHADRGNINGMGNFVDILKTLIRLLYINYKRGLVLRLKAMSRLCDWCELATSGRDTETDFFCGYLYSLWNNLGGDEVLLQKVCDENAFCAELRAMLLIAQKLRYVPGEIPKYEKPPKSQKDVLRRQAEIIKEGIAECGLMEPSKQQVREALGRYQLFSTDEITAMVAAL